jgi:hypothetical protein
MKYLTVTEHKFFVKPCRDISLNSSKTATKSYTNTALQTLPLEPRTYCFDDLGTENNLKYFGNECNVMAEILLSRYDLFISKTKTITTNHSHRIRNTLRKPSTYTLELCNLIASDSHSTDKRK